MKVCDYFRFKEMTERGEAILNSVIKHCYIVCALLLTLHLSEFPSCPVPQLRIQPVLHEAFAQVLGVRSEIDKCPKLEDFYGEGGCSNQERDTLIHHPAPSPNAVRGTRKIFKQKISIHSVNIRKQCCGTRQQGQLPSVLVCLLFWEVASMPCEG